MLNLLIAFHLISQQNYLEKATHFEKAVESVLAKRVRKWENRLHPLLEEQNNRQQYDIEVYRDKVLDSFKQKLAVAKRRRTCVVCECGRTFSVNSISISFLASL